MTRFAQSGYHGTPMAEIARDVGLTFRGLLHHFPSKRLLVVAVAEQRFEDARLFVESAFASDENARALSVLEALTERFASQPGLIELSMLVAAEATATDTPARDMLTERYELGLSLLTGGLLRDQRAARIRADLDCETLARRCIATCDGLLFDWIQSGRNFDVMSVVRDFIADTERAIAV